MNFVVDSCLIIQTPAGLNLKHFFPDANLVNLLPVDFQKLLNSSKTFRFLLASIKFLLSSVSENSVQHLMVEF